MRGPVASRVITAMTMVVALAWTRASAADATSQPAPTSPLRYRLSVGEELVYTTNQNKTRATFYVTRSNPDGGWHVFEIGRVPPLRPNDPANGGALFITRLKCEFDVSPDGKLGDKSAGDTALAMTLFPKLPPGATTREWESTRPQDQSIRFHLLPATQPTEREFAGEVEGPRQTRLKVRTASQVRFDIRRGLAVRVGLEFEELQPLKGKGVHSAWAWELAGDQVHPAPWAEHFGQEAEIAMRARLRYLDVMLAAGNAPDGKGALEGFAAALKELKDSRSRITDPALLEATDWSIRHHPWLAGFVRALHRAGHPLKIEDVDLYS